MSFLRTGKQVHKESKRVDAAMAARDARYKSPYNNRFWVPKGEDKEITFLDGDLDEDGLLKCTAYYEHSVKLDGTWQNFVCVADQESCPICEDNSNPTLVYAFTIIDHTGYVDKDGKEHKNMRKLFICKQGTFKQLQKFATKRNGLVGTTFDVGRVGAKAPAVGDVYDFTEKRSIKEIAQTYGLRVSENDDGVLDQGCVTPFDYVKAINYIEPKALRALGFGTSAIGSNGLDSDSDSALDDDSSIDAVL